MARRIGLVGCVKDKAKYPRPAKDLYESRLFRGRRAFVERSCTEWWILSAEHGLVHPSQVLAPYDVTLKNAGTARRRAWSARVLEELDRRVNLGPNDLAEIHAGVEYRDFGLITGLRSRGAQVAVPAAGLSLGQQLRFYKQAGSHPS